MWVFTGTRLLRTHDLWEAVPSGLGLGCSFLTPETLLRLGTPQSHSDSRPRLCWKRESYTIKVQFIILGYNIPCAS